MTFIWQKRLSLLKSILQTKKPLNDCSAVHQWHPRQPTYIINLYASITRFISEALKLLSHHSNFLFYLSVQSHIKLTAVLH